MSNTKRTQGVTQTIKQEIRSCKQRILVGTKISRKGQHLLKVVVDEKLAPTVLAKDYVAMYYTRNVYRTNPLSKVITEIKHKRIHASLK